MYGTSTIGNGKSGVKTCRDTLDLRELGAPRILVNERGNYLEVRLHPHRAELHDGQPWVGMDGDWEGPGMGKEAEPCVSLS